MPRRVQLRDVAEVVGVSTTSVSLALRDDPRISEVTRRRVKGVAQQIGYLGVRRQSVADRVWRFGFVYLERPGVATFDPIIFEPVQQLLMRESLVLRSRFEMNLSNDDVTDPAARQALTDFAAPLQGVLLYGRVHPSALELLAQLEVPAVVIGETDIPYETAAEFKLQRVTDDPTRAGQLATDYLFRRGKKRIAFVGGIEEAGFYYDQWHRGYITAHAQAGVPIDPQRVFRIDAAAGPISERIKRLLDRAVAPDGFIWPDASIAMKCWPSISGLGLGDADHVVSGYSHVPLPPDLQRCPQMLTDLAAMTREAIRRLQVVCKHPADGAATITLSYVGRNFPEIARRSAAPSSVAT